MRKETMEQDHNDLSKPSKASESDEEEQQGSSLPLYTKTRTV